MLIRGVGSRVRSFLSTSPWTFYSVQLRKARMLSTAAAAARTESSLPVDFNEASSTRVVTLSRPKALNALNMEMIELLLNKYRQWEAAQDSTCIVLKGAGGKAFCAGGDVVMVRDIGVSGASLQDTAEFFRNEYVLDHFIATMKTPQVALLNGFTMGGGVGVSLHGQYRVATESTVFAMPETKIGFFPDVGASHFLPRLKGALGMYLALSGARLKGQDVYHAGVATHFVPENKLDDLEKDLLSAKDRAAVDHILSSYHSAPAQNEALLLGERTDDMHECFGAASVDSIFKCLQRKVESSDENQSSWAVKQLSILKSMSPFSLLVTFDLLNASISRKWSISDCFRMEYRIAVRFMKDGEFFEGVRALLVDKDQKPVWKVSTIEEVTDERVRSCFIPLQDKEGEELDIMTYTPSKL